MGALNQNVFLIGFMGVGKTTVARRLARELGVAAIDVDSYLRRKCGFDASQYYRHYGEEALRRLEAEVLGECCKLGPAVISCGEGIVAASECRRILNDQGYCVLLESSAQESVSRIHSLRTRPLLASGCNTQELWEQRKPLYDQVANACVQVNDMSTYAAACAVMQLLKDRGVYQD
ncbi:MAG: shikimate kinase [Eggerthellales bacterium]|nr:shikimate kinase [Eggerthellales bacterium]